MSEAAVTYNPDLNSAEKSTFHRDELRLLSEYDGKRINTFNSLSLLSKREARRVLHIGNRNLNKLISDGKIKVVDVNGKIKIPYRNLEEYIYEASQASAKADFPDSFDYLPEDAVNEIIKEIIKEHK